VSCRTIKKNLQKPKADQQAFKMEFAVVLATGSNMLGIAVWNTVRIIGLGFTNA
jgi:hypothetical protein